MEEILRFTETEEDIDGNIKYGGMYKTLTIRVSTTSEDRPKTTASKQH